VAPALVSGARKRVRRQTASGFLSTRNAEKPPGKYDGVGWHTFRHTYRSWLDDTGAPIGVQQKLMRHAQVSTTMNVYGNALMTAKREANSKVVKMALRSA
jgi:integrase